MDSSAPPQIDPPTFSREDLLTPTEVAEVLRLRRTTVLDYMRRGVIPAFRVGRQWYSLRPRLDAHLASISDEADHP
jgi:excisionase family DNA binding protein